MEAWGQVGEQPLEELQDVGVLDEVEIIQNQKEGLVEAKDLCCQAGGNDMGRGQLTGAEDGCDFSSKSGAAVLQGGEKAGQETGRIVVGSIQGEPGDEPIVEAFEPLNDRGGFPETGRSGDEGELVLERQPFVQKAAKVRAGDPGRGQGGPVELGSEQVRF
jgi:hypothetical protein